MGMLDKLAIYLGLRRREANVLVIGLDNSGKSTMLNHFRPESNRTTEVVPTVGFNVEKFRSKNVSFTAFDMSGQGRYRNLWEHYYKGCQGIIFVVDSSDKLRLVVAKEELNLLLQHSEIKYRQVPMLFFANKMDVRESLSSVKISAALGLEKIMNKPWHITPSNAVSGEGLHDGIEWLTNQIKENFESSKN